MKFIFGIIIGFIIGVGILYINTIIDLGPLESPLQKAFVVETSILDAFRYTIIDEVNKKKDLPEGGYTPEMFLEVFPGLVMSDFDSVTGTGGIYSIQNGEITFEINEEGLVPSKTGFVTGYNTLLVNVSNRNKIDIAADGTLTDVMKAITVK